MATNPTIPSRFDPTKLTGSTKPVPVDDAKDIFNASTVDSSEQYREQSIQFDVTAKSTDGTTTTAAKNDNPNPNILHGYVNWTYKLALYMIGIQKYNEMMDAGNASPPNFSDGAILLIKSGGIGQSPSVSEDVYIQDMRFTSVIGNRLQGAGTNNFDVTMTVKEPYGAKLIGDIVASASALGYVDTALADIAYVLEIDFAGYTVDGNPVPSILGKNKKYIPLKVITLDIKLEAAGANYTINFVPYSFYVYTPHYANIPNTVSIHSQNVKDALDSLMDILNINEQTTASKENIKTKPNTYSYDVTSFSESSSDTQEMLNSSFSYSSNGKTGVDPWRTFMDVESNTLYGMTLNGGSLIKDAIKNIILSSEYFNKKVNAAGNNSKPTEMLKIIPEVRIQENSFDPKQNEYAKDIKYKVTNTFSYGEVQPGLGTAPVTQRKITKIYNYLFTGKNEDITNLDLNWNLLYYTIRTPALAEKAKHYASSTVTESRPESADLGVITKSRTKIAEITQNWPNMPYRSLPATIVAEYFDSKMTNSFGDNIVVDLEIIGDPEWIPQDASIRGGPIKMGENNYDANRSIAVDVSGVYIKIFLRTPRDYNMNTGLMEINTAKETFIEGTYMVITVENIFESGRFKQKLHLVKVPNQNENTPEEIKDKSEGSIATARAIDRNSVPGYSATSPLVTINPNLI